MTIDASLLSDPERFAENTLPPRSDHRWFASRDEARQGVSSFEQSLNGTWRIHHAPGLAARPEGFEAVDFDVSNWPEIPVPGHLQLHGFGRPQYTNVAYPWDGRFDIWPGQLPEDNPVGSYVRTFDAPQLAPGERLVLRFDGVESAFGLWLNGTWIGYSTDSFTPAEFDITAAVVPGPNRLAVQVFQFSAGSWLEDQDFFRLSGIFRDVTLLRVPAAHVADLRVVTELSEDLERALVTVTATLQGDGVLRAHLDGVGELVDGVVEVSQPRLWSAEQPELHDLWVEVLRDGEVVEVIRQRIGIRRFGIEDGLLTLNGQRIVFNGVNRHEFGRNGRVMGREEIARDLVLLKAHNVNAVRTSHYPNSTAFYELCDELGLYVIDEMNLETHGVWEAKDRGRIELDEVVPGDRPEWLGALLFRAANMLARDINHPCVLMWSCGNESYGGSNLMAVADWFRSQDSRPVHYEGVHQDPRLPATSDVVSRMYATAEEIEEYLAEHRDKPFILCEYAHAMGNSFGAVDRYTELAWREPLYQGGFVWDFADQALPALAPDGSTYWGYGGDFGDHPNDGDFSANGLCFADHTPKPLLIEAKQLYRPVDIQPEQRGFTVTNRYLFTRTSCLRFLVRLLHDGKPGEAVEVPLDLAPGESRWVPWPEWFVGGDGEYVAEVSAGLREATPWAPAGHEVCFAQHVLHASAPHHHAPDAPLLVTGTLNTGVRGDGFGLLFSEVHGGLASWRLGERELLAGGRVLPCFWHAPTSNERGWGAPHRDGMWLLASRYAVLDGSPESRVTEHHAIITHRFRLPGDGSCTMTHAVDGYGRIEVELELTPGKDWPDPPELSVLIPLDGALDQLRWYGEGPHESAIDRRSSARLGIWQQRVADQLTPYVRPQEAGGHTGVRWAELSDGAVAVCFEALGEHWGGQMEFSALPWTPFEIENAEHPWQLPPSGRTVVRATWRRRGVGGDDSWGARTHPEFLLPTGPLHFSFMMRAITLTEGAAGR